tara:strand:- start:70 stop:477 length:408 start_codon:yes stop_codon:yes gene_type:complete
MIIKEKKRAEKFINNNLLRNEYQGHVAWCMDRDCHGVNFLSVKSYDTKWISRILNDPTLQYSCRWCGKKGQFNSIMFMNGELTPNFYRQFREGKIDECVSVMSKFLWTTGNKVRKESLSKVMEELLTYEERFDEK